MYPASFDYARPTSIDEAIALLARHGDDAKVLAGGHSLIPAMKLRLARPAVVVDIGRIAGLSYIRESGGRIAIGATTTHAEVASSALLQRICPVLPETAARIGDAQVRNKGTVGGSLVHADPAADYPAPILALEAEIELAGPVDVDPDVGCLPETEAVVDVAPVVRGVEDDDWPARGRELEDR